MKSGIKRSIALCPLVLLAACGSLPSSTGPSSQAEPPERLFLQQVSSHGAIVKWRGGDAESVCFSRKMKDLKKKKWSGCVDGVETAGGHREAQLTGLEPDKDYFYSVGGIVSADQQFRTPPDSNKPPKDGNTHILIVGDSGTQTELERNGEAAHDGEAAEVLAGFETYNAANGGEPVDLFLALGDNAYLAGTDAQWQGAFFDIYPAILKSAFLLTTIGNHEMGNGPVPLCAVVPSHPKCNPPDYGLRVPFGGVSTSADPESYDGDGDLQPDEGGLPYLDIFSLPAAGESGGVPSGTEQYYSVDYGNVHIVSLDSQLTARDDEARATMREWLIVDLEANDSDWTVVIFHHPPYTKGNNHDSDDAENSPLSIDAPEFHMRDEFTGVFDQYGVDVVYSGHSHSYERSYYLHGHTGTSDTFGDDPQHAELKADGELSLGRETGDTYAQLSRTSGNVDDRVVYTVAGSSGKADHPEADSDYLTVTPGDWLQHAAHVPQPESCGGPYGCRNGLPLKGSVVLDASATSLTAKFVDVNGAVLDHFTITR